MNGLPLDDLVLHDRALFVPRIATLLVSDLQLGREGELRSRGHNIRYQEGRALRDHLLALIARTAATTLVIDGDLKHEFGRISPQERVDILELLRALRERIQVVIVRGNHDTFTAPLAREAGVPMVDMWCAEGYLAVHGHALPDAVPRGTHTVIIGHVHPAITVGDGVRKERCKCFLVGTWARKRLVVLPSLSEITDGGDILLGGSNSPLLAPRSLRRAQVYAIAEGILPFGTVQDVADAMTTR